MRDIAVRFIASSIIACCLCLCAGAAGAKTNAVVKTATAVAESKKSDDAAETPPQLERQLTELSQAPVDYEVAGKWFKLAKDIADNGRRQEAFMAAAAALIYAHKSEVYQKNVRTQIDNAATFEEEFMRECPDCRGGGKSRHPCPACKGSGTCRYANCQGGKHLVYQITGNRYETCRDCKGSGKCQKCKGGGHQERKCTRCGGKGKRIDGELVLAAYEKHVDHAIRWEQVERERKERERKEAEERIAKEREREDRRRKEEELAKIMRAQGLVDIGGKWMTPGSSRNVAYKVFQIYEPGHALCHDGDTIFCLLYSAEDNRTLAEGDVMRNDLYRCGTFSYVTVQNARSTVRQYAIDLSVAQKEIKRQGLH